MNRRRTSRNGLRWAGACLLLVPVAGCGDDAPDAELRAEQAAHLAARAHAAAAATTAPSAPADRDAAPAGEPAATVPDVEPTGVVVQVVALDNSFRPERLEIHVGDEVVWENRGRNDHDVLSIDEDEWGVQQAAFGPGAVYSHVFTQPGEYEYYCSIHGTAKAGMVGTVVVTP